MIDHETEPEERVSGLSRPMSIKDLVLAREAVIESWRALDKARDNVGAAFDMIWDPDFVYDPKQAIKGRGKWDRDRKPSIKEQIEVLDYSIWEFALEKMNITNAMTKGARDEFLEKVAAQKLPFSEKEIQDLSQNAHKLFQESSLNTVREVYRRLIGIGYRGGDWGSGKKDNLQKVEKVFRIGWSDLKVEEVWRKGLRITNNWVTDSMAKNMFRFDDLLTACRLIDGDGMPNYSNNLWAIMNSVPVADQCAELDLDYFLLTAYKNGNIKVRWNEDKIHVLEKFNAIGAGRENELPDPMRKRYRAEHFSNGGTPEAEDYFRPTADLKPSDDKDFAFFPTPKDVAKRMVELAEIPEKKDKPLSILEPSAGDGAIMAEVPRGHYCCVVEFNFHRFEKLIQNWANFWDIAQADFLKWNPSQTFDRVLMNPPFSDRVEAFHVVKAFGHLKPGGILVAIIPEGWFFRTDLKSRIFRAWIQKHEHRPSEVLPPGTFGKTQVATRIIVLRKDAKT